jgi:Uncharacterized protein conserved in bacteria
MRILIDADACPSINLIIEIANKYKIKTLLFHDNTHNLEKHNVETIICDKGYQSVDMILMNEMKENDIIITQDFGVATIAISKKAYSIHPKGMIYDDENIDKILFERHINTKQRDKRKLKGPKKRTNEDDEKLIYSLKTIIEKNS